MKLTTCMFNATTQPDILHCVYERFVSISLCTRATTALFHLGLFLPRSMANKEKNPKG